MTLLLRRAVDRLAFVRVVVRVTFRLRRRPRTLRVVDLLRRDTEALADFLRPPRRAAAERDDDPPRFRADFRPRFAPPDLRDDPPLPDFLRDLRLVAAIHVSPDGRS